MPKFKGLAGLAPPFIYRAAERFCSGVIADSAQLTLSFADDSDPTTSAPVVLLSRLATKEVQNSSLIITEVWNFFRFIKLRL